MNVAGFLRSVSRDGVLLFGYLLGDADRTGCDEFEIRAENGLHFTQFVGVIGCKDDFHRRIVLFGFVEFPDHFGLLACAVCFCGTRVMAFRRIATDSFVLRAGSFEQLQPVIRLDLVDDRLDERIHFGTFGVVGRADVAYAIVADQPVQFAPGVSDLGVIDGDRMSAGVLHQPHAGMSVVPSPT